MSKQNRSLIPIISTIIVAVLAIVMAIVAVVLMTGNKKNDPGTSVSDGGSSVQSSVPFSPTQELIDECTYAAHDLVQDSYRIIRLFLTEGLKHFDEPYGNEPDDGIYTVNSMEYTSLKQIEDFVKSVYVADEAQRILTDIDGNGLAVYQDREVLVTIEETLEATGEAADTEESGPKYKNEIVLGISADFEPIEYNKDWSSCRIAVSPLSEKECKLTVYLNGIDPAAVTEADKDSILEMSMVKNGDEWRLAKFIY